jgi:hypothetical protein
MFKFLDSFPIITDSSTLHWINVLIFDQNLKDFALLIPQHRHTWGEILFYVYLHETFCQRPEDGEIIAPKHVAAM